MIHPLERAYTLMSETFPMPLDPPSLEGFLTALICAPFPVDPSIWLSYVYQDNSGKREFRNASDSLEIQQTLVYYLSELEQRLRNNDFTFYLRKKILSREEGIKKWCEGFFIGISLPSIPEDSKQKDDYFQILTPFMICLNKNIRKETIENNKDIESEEKLLESAIHALPSSIIHLKTIIAANAGDKK